MLAREVENGGKVAAEHHAGANHGRDCNHGGDNSRLISPVWRHHSTATRVESPVGERANLARRGASSPVRVTSTGRGFVSLPLTTDRGRPPQTRPVGERGSIC
ncbi:hypothetical protein GCM10012275_62770 [Longimycelium tulufanense]|uniref:Uncharacterized protein n=1 Tax=Longimycelium tulufanense TaxID=907463 RepID=A0A8J3CKH6_9PSEU|nr:hypothetical protein GCM10012275_62770 [Longimycelium tulufanense]